MGGRRERRGREHEAPHGGSWGQPRAGARSNMYWGHRLRVLVGAGCRTGSFVGIVVGDWTGLDRRRGRSGRRRRAGRRESSGTGLRTIDKVRWQDGLVTFRTIEPGHVSENGRRVGVRPVELTHPRRIARVATTVGPPGTPSGLSSGRRCAAASTASSSRSLLLAYPYAHVRCPVVPSGREKLAFSGERSWARATGWSRTRCRGRRTPAPGRRAGYRAPDARPPRRAAGAPARSPAAAPTRRSARRWRSARHRC